MVSNIGTLCLESSDGMPNLGVRILNVAVCPLHERERQMPEFCISGRSSTFGVPNRSLRQSDKFEGALQSANPPAHKLTNGLAVTR